MPPLRGGVAASHEGSKGARAGSQSPCGGCDRDHVREDVRSRNHDRGRDQRHLDHQLVVGDQKLRRLAFLSRESRITAPVDHPDHFAALQSAAAAARHHGHQPAPSMPDHLRRRQETMSDNAAKPEPIGLSGVTSVRLSAEHTIIALESPMKRFGSETGLRLSSAIRTPRSICITSCSPSAAASLKRPG